MATQRTTATTRTGRRQDNPALSESRRISAELNTLIGPAAAGDSRAISDLLRLIHPLVYRYCRSRMGNTAHLQVTADDVVQEVMLATVHAIPRYREQGKSFLAFVYGIAANKVADAFRRAQTHPVYPTDHMPDTASLAAGPEERALVSERQRATRQLMRVLAPVHREVLVMRIILGWTAAETADAIGTSPGVVRVMQHRALNKLRAELKVAS
ncbi:sigma-70 family RNA polymerase sigma factor [Nocardia cyriacigeorgica]|uniref:Sigma-70 family RNA polymerase sigma factor n=1 Tax=Nocardia cyriacigeorgica TaxID=135487 RepID=A0A5R8NUS2_9NOCA|nr:sigma-70 family RNA polymerase sigma factor [Nocardia cyriacigeorgica]TLF79473.1 sigma-70 family RNA polymerase sigma factor [Nocardia cyriacigeorgica]